MVEDPLQSVAMRNSDDRLGLDSLGLPYIHRDSGCDPTVVTIVMMALVVLCSYSHRATAQATISNGLGR